MKKIILALLIGLTGCTSVAQNTDQLTDSYMAVKDALVNSDAAAAANAITAFQKKVTAEPAFKQKDALLKAISKMGTTADLEKQRENFNEVSTALWKIVKAAKKVSKPVYYQYCPMKDAYWLSYEKEIKNPYYGSSMLNCGKVVETKS